MKAIIILFCSVLDCLTTLGNHLQQVYILEATLQYCLREYSRIQNQIKYEPQDSPLLTKTKAAGKKILTNINSIRKETRTMKTILNKVTSFFLTLIHSLRKLVSLVLWTTLGLIQEY